MYQIHLRAQASKLATLAADWQAGRVQRRAANSPRRRASSLRAALAGLARLATLRAMPDASTDAATQHDPHDPRNW